MHECGRGEKAGLSRPRGLASFSATRSDCPFVQWQDSALWMREWWFESTRGNYTRLEKKGAAPLPFKAGRR